MAAAKPTYKGTKITGTPASGKVFSKSGITNAKVNDTYLNTQTGHVYKCTEAGSASKAKWQYLRTDVIKVPSLGVKSLSAPARQSGSRTMSASWKVPDDLVNSKKGDRAEGLYIDWIFDIEEKKKKGDPKRITKNKNEKTTSASVNLSNFTIKKNYTRGSFYPNNANCHLKAVTAEIIPYNSKGKGKKKATATRIFEAPRAPTLSGFSFNGSTGVLSITITTDPGNDYKERYDTRYVMTIQDTLQNRSWKLYDASSTDTSIGLSYNVSNYQQLDNDRYVKVTVEAWARGYMGDSSHVSKTYYVSRAARATINSVAVSEKNPSGKCTARISTNNSTTHPVDQVELEYLDNVPYATEAAIPAGAAWEGSEITDDASCSALTMSVSKLMPDPGNYTWLRVKSWHAADVPALTRYSKYTRVTQLETPMPTAADDEIDILSLTAGADGISLIAVLGWNADGQDDSDGTELTWSASEDAWKSTRDPDQYTFVWSDGPKSAGGKNYRDHATITIKDLEEGTKYFVRARRFMEGEGETTYSPYSNIATCVTSETPDAVVASCDQYIPNGGFLQVYWTFSGEALQKSWQIVSEEGTVVALGEGSVSSTQISAQRILSLASDRSLTFTVQVSTGSGYVISEPHTATVIEEPTLEITVETPLTVQPFVFSAVVNRLCDLIITVTSQGAVGQFPEGLLRQPAGDTAFSGRLIPMWTASEDNYTAQISLPEGLSFWDLGVYTISVTAVDRETGLRSAEHTEDFTIQWAHQAPSPEEYVTLMPIDEEDESTGHIQAVDIVLAPPEGSIESDFYDIYRLTPDGPYLIGQSFPLSYTARDEYAPFGDAMTHYYRIALRTADGDVEFSDIEYTADGSALRFDWADGTLELPYDISISDKYSKDVSIRKHMDGGMAAYWNAAVTRKSSLRSDLIRLDQQEDVEMVRQLARYAGPVFVRTPDGNAYEAHVQVSDMSTTGKLETIAIDADEIGLTEEFILRTPYRDEEEEQS